MLKLFFVLVLLNLHYVYGQRGSFLGTAKEPLCVKFDNYCEQNADCCSKLCLASTNKCIAAGVSGISDNSSKPASSNLVNRFGEENKPSVCQQVGTNCLLGRDCCSGQCSSDTSKCFDRISSETPSSSTGSQAECGKVNQQCSSAKSCCAFLSCEGTICRDKAVVIEGTETLGYKPTNNTVDNRFGEGENGNQGKPTIAPTNVKCAEIGSKCYKESECCKGLRCHGFLHQCVT